MLNLERHMENISFLALAPKIRILQEQRQFACKPQGDMHGKHMHSNSSQKKNEEIAGKVASYSSSAHVH